MSSCHRILILHNGISPYKIVLFDELCAVSSDIEVLFMAETEKNRQWRIDASELNFPHRIMFKGALDDVNNLVLALKTWKELNLSNPDVLILGGYSYSAYWAGFFWARFHRKKIILWNSSTRNDHPRTFTKEAIKSYMVKRCHAFNAYGSKSKEYIASLGAKDNAILITGNTTDNSFYRRGAEKARLQRQLLCQQLNIPSRNFIFIGRFSEEKNLIRLLDAYRDLQAANTGWGLILVGDGPQKSEIVDYIESFGVRNVFMPGFIQKENIPNYMAVSDVLVLPSISEPWGLVVNEAMAGSLPVLVSNRCGCFPDIVKEAINGFSFDPYDTNQLYMLMKNITQGNYDLKKMGRAASATINDYTPESAAHVIKKTIENVLQEQS